MKKILFRALQVLLIIYLLAAMIAIVASAQQRTVTVTFEHTENLVHVGGGELVQTVSRITALRFPMFEVIQVDGGTPQRVRFSDWDFDLINMIYAGLVNEMTIQVSGQNLNPPQQFIPHYTITFNPNGGYLGNIHHFTQFVQGGIPVPAMLIPNNPIPLRQGYIFAGWSSSLSGSTLESVIGDTEFTVIWTPCPITNPQPEPPPDIQPTPQPPSQPADLSPLIEAIETQTAELTESMEALYEMQDKHLTMIIAMIAISLGGMVGIGVLVLWRPTND